MVREELERVSLLIGEEALSTLNKASVLVAGVGGVGSYACEALARSGIGHLVLVDQDVVVSSNLNRQIMATHDTIGMSKVEAMKTRIHSYQPSCLVETKQMFIGEDCSFVKEVDFVIDAIDTVSSKIALIKACKEANIPFISSLGMGNRLDPSEVEISDLFKTSGDPLARSVRQLARKAGITGAVPVLISKEKPIKQNRIVNEECATRKERIPPASMIFVPAEAGLLAASYAVRTILGGSQYESK
ncbi:MAG: ThiF family adenylyltransferase [Solobacterium sp.]|nr:ThiF family adenylyltransferase [Solobacterium sp.]